MESMDYIMGVRYTQVSPHMMWMSAHILPFVVEEVFLLRLYLDKQGCTFHTELTRQMKDWVVGVDTIGTGGYRITNVGGTRCGCGGTLIWE